MIYRVRLYQRMKTGPKKQRQSPTGCIVNDVLQEGLISRVLIFHMNFYTLCVLAFDIRMISMNKLLITY
ncbi:hypothetical protein GCM10007905_16890 [Mixta theicola]|nr:hypothetical protein GCM10007905_16890 [Mixta theicola]